MILAKESVAVKLGCRMTAPVDSEASRVAVSDMEAFSFFVGNFFVSSRITATQSLLDMTARTIGSLLDF